MKNTRKIDKSVGEGRSKKNKVNWLGHVSAITTVVNLTDLRLSKSEFQ